MTQWSNETINDTRISIVKENALKLIDLVIGWFIATFDITLKNMECWTKEPRNYNKIRHLIRRNVFKKSTTNYPHIALFADHFSGFEKDQLTWWTSDAGNVLLLTLGIGKTISFVRVLP